MEGESSAEMIHKGHKDIQQVVDTQITPMPCVSLSPTLSIWLAKKHDSEETVTWQNTGI